MARINVEDSLFTDARFIALRDEVGEAVAIGKLVISWRIAQNYWIKSELVPIKFWELLNLQVLADFDFAEITENGVYVKGIEENFEWLKQKQASGRKGGLAKASKALAKASTTLANPSTTSFCSSESYPLTLTLTPTLNTNTLILADEACLEAGSLESDLLLSENKVECVKREKQEKPIKQQFDLESIYAQYPKKEGKKKGIEKLKREIKTYEKFTQLEVAVKNYSIKCKNTEIQFIKQFSTFAGCWEDYIAIEIESDEMPQCDTNWGEIDGLKESIC